MLDMYRAERHRLRANLLSLESDDLLTEAQAHIECGNDGEAKRMIKLAGQLDSRALKHLDRAWRLLAKLGY